MGLVDGSRPEEISSLATPDRRMIIDVVPNRAAILRKCSLT